MCHTTLLQNNTKTDRYEWHRGQAVMCVMGQLASSCGRHARVIKFRQQQLYKTDNKVTLVSSSSLQRIVPTKITGLCFTLDSPIPVQGP